MTDSCRRCSGDLIEVADLGPMPLANALDSTEVLPLHLAFCEWCCAVQVVEEVSPDEVFGGEYAYHSSVNGPYVQQCHAVVDEIVDRLGLGPDDLVGEVGSNDGYLLARYVERGIYVMGFEPAANLAAIAEGRGVRTVPDFFGTSLCPNWALVGTMRVIHANNVLAHIPNVNAVLSGIERILAPDGIVVVETPYVRDLAERVQWDTIYHEHIFYWSLLAFNRAARANGMAVIDVKRIPSHCGSLRITLARQGSWTATYRVGDMLADERRAGVDTPDYYWTFAAKVDEAKARLRTKIMRAAEQGPVAAFGAAAKGTVLLNGLALPEYLIEYVVDDTPYKQGRHIPGYGALIVPSTQLRAEPKPVAVILLAWNYAREIMAAHPEVSDWIVPNMQPVGPLAKSA